MKGWMEVEEVLLSLLRWTDVPANLSIEFAETPTQSTEKRVIGAGRAILKPKCRLVASHFQPD